MLVVVVVVLVVCRGLAGIVDQRPRKVEFLTIVVEVVVVV
jgi:hypothetical protein